MIAVSARENARGYKYDFHSLYAFVVSFTISCFAFVAVANAFVPISLIRENRQKITDGAISRVYFPREDVSKAVEGECTTSPEEFLDIISFPVPDDVKDNFLSLSGSVCIKQIYQSALSMIDEEAFTREHIGNIVVFMPNVRSCLFEKRWFESRKQFLVSAGITRLANRICFQRNLFGSYIDQRDESKVNLPLSKDEERAAELLFNFGRNFNFLSFIWNFSFGRIQRWIAAAIFSKKNMIRAYNPGSKHISGEGRLFSDHDCVCFLNKKLIGFSYEIFMKNMINNVLSGHTSLFYREVHQAIGQKETAKQITMSMGGDEGLEMIGVPPSSKTFSKEVNINSLAALMPVIIVAIYENMAHFKLPNHLVVYNYAIMLKLFEKQNEMILSAASCGAL